MIERDHLRLSLSRQCGLLSISRSSFYYTPKGESPENLALMRRIDALFLQYPFYGSRQMSRHLRREGFYAGRHRVRGLMRLMGLAPIYRAAKASTPHPERLVYPYLLKGLSIERPDHACPCEGRDRAADITYIPVQRGFLSLVALIALRQAQEGELACAGTAAVEHPQCPVLRGGTHRRNGPLRSAGHIQQ